MQKTLCLITLMMLAVLSVKAQPKAMFSANPNKGCSPATIQFSNQSTGSSLTYLWDLGNGNTSIIKDPRAIYYTPGFYTVKLIVTDNSGRKDSFTRVKYVEVFRNPVADFMAKTTQGCTPFDPGLTDRSVRGSGMITQWTWDYGNGIIKTGSSPTYGYSKEGVYDISLLIVDQNGCKSDTTIKKYITAYEAPQALFIADKTSSCAQPLTVNFSNLSTGLKGTDQFTWNFGDGTTSSAKSPQKTYTDTGKYQVTLNIKSANGCITTLQLKNFINITKVKPGFTVFPSQICQNGSVMIQNTSKPSTLNYVCNWNFGDSTSGTGSKVSHKYTKSGSYDVKLNVSLPDGSCAETVTLKNAVNVLTKPLAKFTISDTILCLPGLQDTFIDKSVGSNSRIWYIKEYSKFYQVSNKVGFVHRLFKKGDTKMMLVSSNGLCEDTLIRNVYVDSIMPNIGLDKHKGCAPLKIRFNDYTQTRLPITQRVWDLGDGNYQTSSTFEHTYTTPGVYVVRLTVTTEKGCTRSAVDTVYVGRKPKTVMNYPFTTKCNMDTLYYTGAKIMNGVIVDEWHWYLDDSLILRTKDLEYKLKTKPDLYDLKLVTGNYECYDTVGLDDILKVNHPLVSFSVISDTCNGYPYIFVNTTDSADVFGWIMNNNSMVLNKDTIVVNSKSDKWPMVLWGKNTKYGCTDTIKNRLLPFSNYLDFKHSGSLCAGSPVAFFNYSTPAMFVWNWGDGVIEKNNDDWIKRAYSQPGDYTVTLKAIQSNGCKDSLKKQVKIVGPSVDLEVYPKKGCSPLTVTLISRITSQNIKNKFWHISGVPPIPVTSDTMTYTLTKPGPLKGGKYTIGLACEDENGCVSTKTDSVNVSGLAYSFEVLELLTCGYPKFTIRPQFDDENLSSKDFNYFWDVGDGRKFTGSPVDYYYKNKGSYNVSLKVIDETGCATQRDTLVMNSEKTVTANMIADVLDANCPPLRVNFVAQAKSKVGNIVSWEWDFGDGITSTLPNPSHIYLVSGKFTVTLTAKDDLGCTDKIVYKDLILIDGPVGSFVFDKKVGCTPLKVNFNSTVSNTFKLEWDMGDGEVIEDSLSLSHLYQRVGNYIPLLVLADSFGCKYTLPPIDTIKVYPQPIPLFSFTTPCLNQSVSFKNTSLPLKGAIKRCYWDFGDGDTSSLTEPKHIYKAKGVFIVKLRVWNTGDCSEEITKQIVIKSIDADFKTGKEFYCAGQIPSLINTSKSDTSITRFYWFLNDSLLSVNSTPTLNVLTTGVYKVALAVQDLNGCVDTLTKDYGLYIGDTIAPLSPFIYRVSVENDASVILNYSGNNVFDFKHYTIYTLNPTGVYTKLQTNPNGNNPNSIIGGLNTLHNSYCYKVTASNLCGYESDIDLSSEHCSVENKATGQMKSIKVSWNSYTGWPVKTYEVYREDLGERGKFNYLATVGGSELTYIDTNVFCKINHCYKIKAIEQGGHQEISWSDTSAAKPLFENAIPPNTTIRASVESDKDIIIEWLGSGSSKVPIKEYVLEKSLDGINFNWKQSFTPNEFTFTDKKVEVDNRSYFYRTYAIDTCELKSPITNFAKSILLFADTTPQERPFVTWSSYQGWLEGVNQYEVQRKKEDGTFVTLGFVSANDSLFVDNISDLNGYPFYCYRVIGHKITRTTQQIISISNEDCAPVRSRIFAPNAFTINGDGINETFDIKGLYIKRYTIKIFTRWGEKVFESNDMNIDWDGSFKGEISQLDAYIWIINAVGVDDVNWPMSGTVTIIR